MKNCDWSANPIGCFDVFLENRGYSDRSKKSYKSIFCSFVDFLKKHNESVISANDRILNEWLIYCAVSAQTEIRYLSLISSVFDEMFDASAIDENFAKRLIDKKMKLKRGKSGKRLPVALDEKEFNLLIAKINEDGVLPRIKITVLLLLACGLRVSEYCELTAANVHLDVDHPYLRVIGKGDKEREIPLPEEVCVALAQHEASLPDLNGLFVGVERKGRLVPYTPSGVFRMIQKLMREAGIVKRRMSPHVLRHTYATRQLQAGVPIATLRMWMGHESIATTMIYESSVIARSSVRPKL